MLNSRKLKARMVELGLTQKDVAEALSVNRSTASLKLNGRRPLYIEDAEKLCDLLRIPASEISAYFFNHEIS